MPLIPPLRPQQRRPQQAVSTGPEISSLTPASGRTAGGDSVVIAGKNFRKGADGSFPTVTIDGLSATVTAIAADGTSLTVTTPATSTTGYVDVVVTNPSPVQSDTFAGGFLYFAGTILEVKPSFSITSGGIQVTVKGISLTSGASFTFGGTPATAAVFIDDTQYVVTVPAHAAGYVDVQMTEVGGHTSTIRHGFQYTTLARGSDIRRLPGTQISKALGNGAWTARFNIDGNSNKPVAGEEIQVVDDFDSGRVLFHGLIQVADQMYEGQITQLVWSCTAGDFQYMLNKFRPFGSYIAAPADLVVRDLMGKNAPDFDLTFVQTNLAPVTLTFDGTKTMSEALDTIGRAIGGGRWYLDGRALHFFNPPAPSTIVIPAGSTGTGADFTVPVLSLGNSLGTTAQYTKAYYAVRVSFLYSNGTESRLGPTSNAIASDGGHFLTVSSLPIGTDPGGGITVVGRKIYYLAGSDPLANGVQINDNTTNAVSFAPLPEVTPSAGTNTVGDPVTQTSTGSTSGATSQTTAFKPAFSASPFYYQGSDLGMFFEFGGTPKFNYVNNITDLRGGFIVPIAPGDSVGVSARSYAYWVKFAINFVYPDGSTTQLSDFAGNDSNPFGGYFLGNITSGSPNQPPTYTCFYWPQGFAAPLVNGKAPYLANLFMQVVGTRGISIGGGSNDQPIPNPTVQTLGTIPYFDGTNASGPTRGGTSLDGGTIVDQRPVDFGSQPAQVPGQVQLTYVWPNPDGPYLEDFANPHDIDDNDQDLLHEDSGSQPFVSTEDITQLRNRVRVYGASSVTIADANPGDNAVAIANPDTFPIGGGKVVAQNGVELSFFSVSSQIDSTNTPAKLLLTAPLQHAIPNGTVVSFYCIAEDKAAQANRGLIELDSLGNPTDGIHEYVIRDESLNTTQSVYLRANAELSIFKDPIITIRYATRDPSRPGARVNVDLTNPPCQGTFLIQSVEIDQIRDEGDQLAPRYTVTATSVFYDLTNFLLLLTAGSQVAGAGSQSSIGGGSSSTVGVVGGAAQLAQANTSGALDITGLKDVVFFSHALAGTNSAVAILGTALSASGNNSTTNINDVRGSWIRLASTTVANANSVTCSSFTVRAEQNTSYRTHFRLAAAAGSARWWIGFKQSAAPIFPNNDSIVGLGPGFGVRYSVGPVPQGVTVANDGGFRLFTSDNNVQTMGTTLSQVPIVSGYEYDLTIEVIGGGAAFIATLTAFNSTGGQVATQNATMVLPPACVNVNLAFAMFQYQLHATLPVSYDFMRGMLIQGLGS